MAVALHIVVLCLGFALCQVAAYDYNDLLNKALLFFQAQRSGKLYGMSPLVSWRGDSALNDRGYNGEDLTGGYYDAADYVKFGFPMAYTVTVLSWGLLEYERGYQKAGAADEARAAIRWATDYFLKAHISPNEFYGQVGDGYLDHEYWGRPEDMTMARPAYLLHAGAPGSDLVAETAAALAAASMVFKWVDGDYANTLLWHAEQLYTFADTYRGKYTDSITNAKEFYNSNGYEDELVWGAAWLYRATNNQLYLSKAEQYYDDYGMQYRLSPLSWDDKSIGATTLLAKMTGNSKYMTVLTTFCDNVINHQQRTPKGLVFFSEWGSLRLSANAAFICLQAANLGINVNPNWDFAKQQVDYMLGGTGRSFVTAFGNNPPTHYQHRAASCPNQPEKCDWSTFANGMPNFQTVYGALVGGPDANDGYEDIRNDYVHNEIACDYNAGFAGLIAAINQD